MMGLEKLMMLAEDPQIIHAGLERITGILETVLRRSAEAGPGRFDAGFLPAILAVSKVR